MYTFDILNMNYQLDLSYTKYDILERIAVEMLGMINRGETKYLSEPINIKDFINRSMDINVIYAGGFYMHFTDECQVYIRQDKKKLEAIYRGYNKNDGSKVEYSVMTSEENILFLITPSRILDFRTKEIASNYGFLTDRELITVLRNKINNNIVEEITKLLPNIICILKEKNKNFLEECTDRNKIFMIEQIIKKSNHLKEIPIEYISKEMLRGLSKLVSLELSKSKYDKRFKKALLKDNDVQKLQNSLLKTISKAVETQIFRKNNQLFDNNIKEIILLNEDTQLKELIDSIVMYNKKIHEKYDELGVLIDKQNAYINSSDYQNKDKTYSLVINGTEIKGIQHNSLSLNYRIITHNGIRFSMRYIGMRYYNAKHKESYKDSIEDTYELFGKPESCTLLKHKDDYSINKLTITTPRKKVIYTISEEEHNELNSLLSKIKNIVNK